MNSGIGTKRLRWLLGTAAFCVATMLPGLSTASSKAIDPEAEKILKSATEYLAGQQQFSVKTQSSIEVVLENGQKLQLLHGARMSLKRPDRMRAERHGDLLEQVLYYDGKRVTVHNPADGYYASAAAPGSIEEMLDFARESLDIVAPAGDLIYSNAFDILMQDVESGFVVGESMVSGVRCDHLAFHGPATDWQIWIQQGDKPLPYKMVITSRDVLSAPQFSVTMSDWNLAPSFTPDTFSFTPPADAVAIEFLPPQSGTGQ